MDGNVVRSLRDQGKEAMYIFSELDTNGDCRQFTCHLVSACRELGVKFEFGAKVTGFGRGADGGADVLLEDGRCVTAGNLVLAAGTRSPELASLLGLYLPMYPVKGYAITVPLNPGFEQLQCNVVQDSKKVYLAPLGKEHIRISGCAEFAGFDTSVEDDRASQLLEQSAALLPGMLDVDRAEKHAGLRPLSADDVPIIGRVGPGIFLNTGHGSKGWTHAFGSARLVADIVAGDEPELAVEPYGLARFWPVRGSGACPVRLRGRYWSPSARDLVA